MKSTRNVCRLWKEEGTRALDSKFKISLNLSGTDGSCHDKLAHFLRTHRLRHKLFLSLVDYSWFSHVDYLWFSHNFVYNKKCLNILPKYWKQGSNLDYFNHTFQLFMSSRSAILIVSLHLELGMVNTADAGTLTSILSATKNLNTLFVDLISWELPKDQLKQLSFPNIRKFGLRIHSEVRVSTSNFLPI